MNDIDHKIQHLQSIAAESGLVIYEILFRNAGVGIKWFDEKRCVTPEIALPDFPACTSEDWTETLRKRSAALDKRLHEGLFVHKYYPTLSKCIEGEGKRLLEEKITA